ncbi:MAG TPA: SDR family NAD(P)-dependent oxidoreductase [Sphingobium sp.]
MDDFLGRVAVVTGGSSGIGKGIAQKFKEAGATVVVTGRNREALDAVTRELGIDAEQVDATDALAMQDLARRITVRHGRVDILVNNAGVGPTGRLADMTLEDWKWLLDSNLISVINGLDAFLPILRANADGGYIVNTSSISGMFTAPTIGAYATTKYAVLAISETLAQELAQEGGKVGVSVFLPGPVRSNTHESGRNRPAAFASGGLRDTRLEDAEGFEGVTITLDGRGCCRTMRRRCDAATRPLHLDPS